jgi:hypothetical protein
VDSMIMQNAEEKEIKGHLRDYFEKPSDVDRLFQELIKNPPCYDAVDKVSSRYEIPYSDSPAGVMQYLIPKTKYFINIRLSTIAIIALILDIKWTKGFASLLAAIVGNTGQSFTLLTSNQRCVLQFILDNKQRYLDVTKYLSTKECMHFDMEHCSLRSGTSCNYSQTNLLKDLEELARKNVLIEENGMYRIAF